MTCEEILKIKKEVEEKINENKKLFIDALKKINKTLENLLIKNLKISIYIDGDDYEYYIYKNNLDNKIYISKEYHDWEEQRNYPIDEVPLDKIIEDLEEDRNINTFIDFDVIEKLVYKFEKILKSIKSEYKNYKEELENNNKILEKLTENLN